MNDGKSVTPKDCEEFDFLQSLLNSLLDDLERKLDFGLSYDRLIINDRLSCEGIAFVTKTLPLFFKDVLFALENGVSTFLGSFALRCFGTTRDKYQSEIPAFLPGILSRIFFSEDDMVQTIALRALYQLCALLAKYKLPFSNEVLHQQIKKVIEDDENLPSEFTTEEQGRVLFYASEALRDLLGSLDLNEIHPRSGRGAVFPKAEQWEKYFVPYDSQMEEQYDSGDMFCPSPLMRSKGYLVDWERALLSSPFYHRPRTFRSEVCDDFPINPLIAKLTAVPKTNLEARLINVENALRMRIQQGQREALYQYVERHPLTKGHVAFSRQDINGRLALESSLTRKNGTMDLSKASDLNGLALVAAIWPSNVFRKLASSRTARCYVPPLELSSGKVIPERTFTMRKFAPMGSAVCFPVEALTFWALGIAALLVKHEKWSLQRAASTIYVYGDDIIVESCDVDAVANTLELFGLKVNRSKTFVRGYFRESCGVDAYKGQVVSPIRIKHRRPEGVDDAESLISWIALSDSLYEAGYTRTAWLMHDHVESILGHLPYSPDRRFIGWRNEAFVLIRERMVKERNHGLKYVRGVSTTLATPVDGHCLTPKESIIFGIAPFYQGRRSKRWVIRASHVSVLDDPAYPDDKAYLRWVEPKREVEPWMNVTQDALALAERCLTTSRDFTLKHVMLKKVYNVIT